MTLDPGLSETGSKHTSTQYQPFPLEEKRTGQATVIRQEKKSSKSDNGSHLELKSPTANSAICLQLFPSHYGNTDSKSSAEDSSLENVTLGHFSIIRRIGSGGMGAVFAADDNLLSRVVALKVLSPELSRDLSAVKRFQNEARAAAQLDHDNIARIYYSGEDQGLYYISFEFIEGTNIKDMIEQQRRLPIQLAVNYILQLASALRHTRSKGVVHRDIKPSNIIIQKNGRAKLVDWGLARASEAYDLSRDLTVDGTTLGTFDYISPEQARDPRKVDVRSDIYSLGCTFYHMVTGEAPYSHGTMLQKLLDHNSKDTPDPRRLNSEISSDLSRIIQKMMNSDPEFRYQSPEDLIQDLVIHSHRSTNDNLPLDSYIIQDRDEKDIPFWKRHLVFLSTCFLVVFISLLSWQVMNQTQHTLGKSQNFPIQPPPSFAGMNSVNSPDINSTKTKNPRSPDSDNTKTELLPPGNSSLNDKTNTKTSDIENIDFNNNPSAIENMLTPDSLNNPSKNTSPLIAPGKPYVVTLEGNILNSFDTLADAVENAPDNSVIEVSENKPLENKTHIENHQIQLARKTLTLKGANGSTPAIIFRNQGYSFPGAIRLSQGAKLNIQNLHLVLFVNDGIDTEQISLFNLIQAKSLNLQNVCITVNNNTQKNCQIINLASNSDEIITEINKMNEVGIEPSSIKISDSIIHGDGDLFVVKTARPVNISLSQVAVGLEGSLLRHEGNAVQQREDENFNMELDHVTCFLGQGFLAADVGETPRRLPKMFIQSRNSIFSNISSSPVPFVSFIGGVILESDLITRINWSGDKNFYQNFALMLDVKLIGMDQNDFLPWLPNDWKSHWNTTESNSAWNSVNWDMPDHSTSTTYWKLNHFQLDPASNLDAGVNINKLPKLNFIDLR